MHKNWFFKVNYANECYALKPKPLAKLRFYLTFRVIKKPDIILSSFVAAKKCMCSLFFLEQSSCDTLICFLDRKYVLTSRPLEKFFLQLLVKKTCCLHLLSSSPAAASSRKSFLNFAESKEFFAAYINVSPMYTVSKTCETASSTQGSKTSPCRTQCRDAFVAKNVSSGVLLVHNSKRS